MTDLNTEKMNYKPVNNTRTNNNVQALTSAMGVGLLGVAGGAVGGAIKKVNIMNKDGVAKDTFVKTVYDKYVNSAADTKLQEFEKQHSAIIQKLNNVKNKEELKKVVNDNKEIIDKVLAPSGQTAETYAEGIQWYSRLGKKKQNIINSIKNTHDSYVNDIRNKISECWNVTTKKFEQANGVPDEVYKVIKKTKNGIKAKQIAKTAGKTGLIAGAGTFVLIKLLGLIQNKRAKKQPIIA